MIQPLRRRNISRRKSRGLASSSLQFECLESRRVLADVSGFINSDLTFTDPAEPVRFVGDTTIGNNVTISIGPGVSVEILSSAIVEIEGTLSIDSASQVGFFDNSGFFSDLTGIVVKSGGLLDAQNTQFVLSTTSTEDRSEIEIRAGGRLQLDNSTVSIDALKWSNGALVDAGDLTQNQFNTPLTISANAIPHLTNNRSFGLVNINSETITGQITATQIGTESTANLIYRFAEDVTISSGADVVFAPNTRVQVGQGVFVSVEGRLEFDSPTQVGFYDSSANFVDRVGIEVLTGGLLVATDTSLVQLTSSTEDVSEINIRSGGRFQMTDSDISIDAVNWYEGSLLSSGNVTGNAFQSQILLPGNYIPELVDNRSFGLVQIGGSNITNSFTATQMGTQSTANLLYRFVNDVTITDGVNVTFAPGTRVQVGESVFIDIEGMLHFDHTAQVGFRDASANFVDRVGINVLSGGLLKVTDTSFVLTTSSTEDISEVIVRAGGRLQITDSDINIDSISWLAGSLLSADNLTGNAIQSSLLLPGDYIPQLVNNRSFGLIQISEETIGDNIVLGKMGSESTANLVYRFSRDVLIADGASVEFAPGTEVEVAASVYVDVEGTLRFNAPAQVGFYDDSPNFADRLGIRVYGGGLLEAHSTNFVELTSSTSDYSEVIVFDSGTISLVNSDFEIDFLQLNSGSINTLDANLLETTLLVHSSAILLDANDNSFAAGKVEATGDPLAVIDLRGNYWGSLNPSVIEDRILHKPDDANRPTVLFDPPSTGAPIYAAGDNFAIQADQVLTMPASTLLSNDTDNVPGPNPLSIMAVNGVPANLGVATLLPSGASVIVNADGSFSYDPNGAFDLLAQGAIRTDVFQYTLTDGVSTDVATVTIAITGTNEDNIAPTISTINDLTFNEDESSLPILFTIGDTDDDLSTLTVHAFAADQTLIPAGGISISGTGASRALTITPAANQFGTTEVTVLVEDPRGGFVSETFLVTVTGVNDLPTISSIGNQVATVDTVLEIPFSLFDADDSVNLLTVNATAADPLVIQQVEVVGTGANRILRVTPVAGAQGTSGITLTVDDGEAVVTRQFDVQFAASGVVLSFVFNIPGIGQVTPGDTIQLPPDTEVTVSIVAENLLDTDISFFQFNFDNSALGAGLLSLSNWSSAFEVAADAMLNTPSDTFVAHTTTAPSSGAVTLGTFTLQTPAFNPLGTQEFLLSVNHTTGNELIDTLIANINGVDAELLPIVDYGDVLIQFDADGPQVIGVEVNAEMTDPANLPAGMQPTSWAQQRSDIRTIQITFNEEVETVTANQLVLTNLGVDADTDADQVIPLTDAMLTQDGNVVTITFARGQLPDGVYQIDVLPSVSDLLGNTLDGNGDGLGGDAYQLVGSEANQLFRLLGDYNGSGFVNIQDAATLTYWFGQAVPTAPEYVDVNGSGGINILDYSAYIGNFQKELIFPEIPSMQSFSFDMTGLLESEPIELESPSSEMMTFVMPSQTAAVPVASSESPAEVENTTAGPTYVDSVMPPSISTDSLGFAQHDSEEIAGSLETPAPGDLGSSLDIESIDLILAAQDSDADVIGDSDHESDELFLGIYDDDFAEFAL